MGRNCGDGGRGLGEVILASVARQERAELYTLVTLRPDLRDVRSSRRTRAVPIRPHGARAR